MKLKPGDTNVYYEVYGFDDIEGLGNPLIQKDTFKAADDFAKSLNYESIGYFNDVELKMSLHIIKVTSEVIK